MEGKLCAVYSKLDRICTAFALRSKMKPINNRKSWMETKSIRLSLSDFPLSATAGKLLSCRPADARLRPFSSQLLGCHSCHTRCKSVADRKLFLTGAASVVFLPLSQGLPT